MPIDPTKLSDEGLQNLIENYRRKKATHEKIYSDAIAEQGRRKGKGLNFETTVRVVREAALRGEFISYGEVAEASGADWKKVRHAIGPHLDDLIEYCHLHGLPLLSAIVVNKPNLKTGELDPDSLKGFIAGVRRVEIPVGDERAFLKQSQKEVFDWARASKPDGP